MALAHSLAALVGIFFVALYVVQMIAPALFALVFNAQFYGADIAGLVPEMAFSEWIVVVVVSAATAWVMGYVWAWLYNHLAKK